MLKWEGHMSLTGEGRDTYRVLVGKPVVYHFKNLRLDGRIILKWILKSRVEGPEL
jgi:hypothetical protein